MGEERDGKMSECGKGVEVIENCGRDCSNPVICPAKAGHSSDLGAQMLSCLCFPPLSSAPALFTAPRSISLSLASFIECQGVVLAQPNSQFTVFTHTTGYLKFRQNKRSFFLYSCSHLNFSPISCILMFPQLYKVRGAPQEKPHSLSRRNGNTI